MTVSPTTSEGTQGPAADPPPPRTGSLVRYKGPLPGRLTRAVNGMVLALWSSPRWGRLAGRHFTVMTYTGRRSGRTFSTPVGYRRTGDTVTIAVSLPERKTWWRNFTGDGSPLSLHLDGADRAGHAVALADGQDRVTVTVQLGHHSGTAETN